MTDGHVAAAFVPEAELFVLDGISLVLGALVAMATGVAVYLYVPRNDKTDALDAEHRLVFERWSAKCMSARQRGEQPPGPPREPIVALFGLPRLSLSDDIGTPYRALVTQMGGSNTEWEAASRFAPAVPKQARRLTVAIDTEDHRARACALSLYAPAA